MKKVLVVLAAVVAGLVSMTVVGGLLGEDESTEERVQAYVTGTEAREYVSAESRFRATFPGAPERSTETQEAAGTSVVTETFTKSAGEAEFSIGVTALGEGMQFDLDGGVNGAAAAVNGKVESSTKLKVQNFDAVEFVISVKEGVFAKAVLIKTPTRAYHVQVAGKANPPAGYDTFKASFQILP